MLTSKLRPKTLCLTSFTYFDLFTFFCFRNRP